MTLDTTRIIVARVSLIVFVGAAAVAATGCPYLQLMQLDESAAPPLNAIHKAVSRSNDKVLLRSSLSAHAGSTDKEQEEDGGGPFPSNDPLVALNTRFTESYDIAKQKMEPKQIYPIITVGMGMKLYLGPDTVVETNSTVFPSDGWRREKMPCHTVLGLFVALLPDCDSGSLTDAAKNALVFTIETIPKALEGTVPAHWTDLKDRAVQERLLTSALEFAKAVLAAGAVTRAALDGFVRATVPDIKRNIAIAAREEIDMMDRVMRVWRKEHLSDPALWNRLRVVVQTSHMPRQGEMHLQYFQRLLRKGDPYITVAENVVNKEGAFSLMMTEMLDKEIGISFFHDPRRMHRDAMADGALEYLNKKFPPYTDPFEGGLYDHESRGVFTGPWDGATETGAPTR